MSKVFLLGKDRFSAMSVSWNITPLYNSALLFLPTQKEIELNPVGVVLSMQPKPYRFLRRRAVGLIYVDWARTAGTFMDSSPVYIHKYTILYGWLRVNCWTYLYN